MAIRDGVCARIDELEPLLWELACRIRGTPELAFSEETAAEWLSAFLAGEEFAVERGAAGLPTAFLARHLAVYGGPSLALVAEYDTLPELGHACGHNLIAVAAVGAAAHALPSGVMAEQVHPFTNEPISVSPLTWIHATFVLTVCEYLDRQAALGST